MPAHRDATYVNLHPPKGASLDGDSQPLYLLESAYAMHWGNHNARDVLLVDTSFSNLSIFSLGNATDPAALLLPGASSLQVETVTVPVRGTDAATPSTGVALYSKDVSGTDHLFARTDDGTVHQLTPPGGGGSFDPTAITLADNTSGAFRANEGANDYLRVNTTNASEAIILGNATTNPSISTVGSGAFRVGSGLVSMPDNTAGALVFVDASLAAYLNLTTTTANPIIELGNATNNPELYWTGAGAWNVGGGFGTSGQVLTSNGNAAAPTWQTGSSFDPTNITINASASGALRIHDGTQDWIRANTDTPLLAFGNATDNPAFTFLGSGVLTLGSGRIAKTGNLLIGDHTVAPGGTGIIAIGGKVSGSWTSNNQVIIGTTTGNYGAGAIVIASQTMTGNAGANSVTIGTDASAVATGADAVAIGPSCTASATGGLTVGRDSTNSGAAGVALGEGVSVTQTGAVAIGWAASATAQYGIALGRSASAGHYALVLGRDAASTAAAQVVIGGNGSELNAVYIGEGVTRAAAPAIGQVTIQPTEYTGTNRAGIGLHLVGGRGTGTGTAGSVLIRGYPSGTTGTTPHTLTTLWEFNPNGTLIPSASSGTRVAIGSFNSAPSQANAVLIGRFPNWTGAANDDVVFIGASSATSLAGARSVNICSQGKSASSAADAITIQSSSANGATGNRSISIGGNGAVSAAESIGIGYAHSATHANCVALGRAATTTAVSQFVVGGNAQPITDFYLGEGVSQASAYTATAITMQPTEATGTNRDGLPLTIHGGRGTGTGNAGATNGSITLSTYPAIGTGTTQHTATPRFRARADGVMLQASHGTMSNADERDEVRHWQTGATDTPSASTTYPVMVIAPENTANNGIYSVEGVLTGWVHTAAPVKISFFFKLTFEVVSGTPSILRYWILDMIGGSTGWVSGSPSWADVSGATVRINQVTTGGQTGGRISGWCQWNGVEY